MPKKNISCPCFCYFCDNTNPNNKDSIVKVHSSKSNIQEIDSYNNMKIIACSCCSCSCCSCNCIAINCCIKDSFIDFAFEIDDNIALLLCINSDVNINLGKSINEKAEEIRNCKLLKSYKNKENRYFYILILPSKEPKRLTGHKPIDVPWWNSIKKFIDEINNLEHFHKLEDIIEKKIIFSGKTIGVPFDKNTGIEGIKFFSRPSEI